jgi:hypothetical protein
MSVSVISNIRSQLTTFKANASNSSRANDKTGVAKSSPDKTKLKYEANINDKAELTDSKLTEPKLISKFSLANTVNSSLNKLGLTGKREQASQMSQFHGRPINEMTLNRLLDGEKLSPQEFIKARLYKLSLDETLNEFRLSVTKSTFNIRQVFQEKFGDNLNNDLLTTEIKVAYVKQLGANLQINNQADLETVEKKFTEDLVALKADGATDKLLTIKGRAPNLINDLLNKVDEGFNYRESSFEIKESGRSPQESNISLSLKLKQQLVKAYLEFAPANVRDLLSLDRLPEPSLPVSNLKKGYDHLTKAAPVDFFDLTWSKDNTGEVKPYTQFDEQVAEPKANIKTFLNSLKKLENILDFIELKPADRDFVENLLELKLEYNTPLLKDL